jgi:hypothetical protein
LNAKVLNDYLLTLANDESITSVEKYKDMKNLNHLIIDTCITTDEHFSKLFEGLS